MNKHSLKIAGLLLAGGILLQVTGCATVLVRQLASNIISGLLSTLISNIIGAANTTTG